MTIMEQRDRPLRVPISEASKRGVSWLNDTVSERRILLTKFGQTTSVVDSAERLDELAARIDEAREVVERYADAALERTSRFTLQEACEKLGLDIDRVLERSRQLRG